MEKETETEVEMKMQDHQEGDKQCHDNAPDKTPGFCHRGRSASLLKVQEVLFLPAWFQARVSSVGASCRGHSQLSPDRPKLSLL